jgi:3-oxoacyl-[acyl-carrier protein] reductase
VARFGVLVNSIAPGFIYTEAAADAYSRDELESVSGEIPVGRLGRPEEVASLASWLLSEENTYLTGQNILIDGGLTRTARP